MSTAQDILAVPGMISLVDGRFLHWGVFSISVANLLIILVMVILFVGALLAPFPHRDRSVDVDHHGDRPVQ